MAFQNLALAPSMRNMLEQRSLLVRAGNTDAVHSSTRTILEPDSARFLGQAAYYKRPEGWLGWLRGETIKVYETEDASLLMTVSRPWVFSRTWEVRDAEDRRVGIIYRNRLWDARGERLFAVEATSASLRFRNTAGREAASAQLREGNDWLLTFHEVSEGNPFARMAILAKALLWWV